MKTGLLIIGSGIVIIFIMLLASMRLKDSKMCKWRTALDYIIITYLAVLSVFSLLNYFYVQDVKHNTKAPVAESESSPTDFDEPRDDLDY